MRAGLDAPDHTTLSRRGQLLDVTMHNILATGPLHLIIDSTGLSVEGEGEWAAATHGGRGTRVWKKLHLGVDRAGLIVGHVLTEATVDDATVGIDLIGAAAGNVASVTADAAYDTVAFSEAARATRAGRRAADHDGTGVAPRTTLECPAWETPSSATSPSSGLAFERVAEAAARSRRVLRAAP